MTTQDSPNFFDELSINILKVHAIDTAERFNKKYPVIRRIILYRKTSIVYLVKYLLLFEVAEAERNDKEYSDYLEVILNVMVAGKGAALVSEHEYKKFYKNHQDQPKTEWEIKIRSHGFEFNLKDVIQSSELVIYEYTKQADKKRPFKETKSSNVDPNSQNNKIKIASLIVCGVSGEEIYIKEPRKPKKFFKHDHCGFKRSDTKEWKALIGTLRTPPYRYHYIKGSDKHRTRLKNINKKLISHIAKNFSNVKIPDDGKLYERCKGEEPGTFQFKFKIDSVKYSESKDSDRLRKQYEKLSKEKLLSLCFEMMKEYLEKPEDYLIKKIKTAITVLMENHLYTINEFLDLYQERTDTEIDKKVIAKVFSIPQEGYKEAINQEAINPGVFEDDDTGS